jgi:hypothetical protein
VSHLTLFVLIFRTHLKSRQIYYGSTEASLQPYSVRVSAESRFAASDWAATGENRRMDFIGQSYRHQRGLARTQPHRCSITTANF